MLTIFTDGGFSMYPVLGFGFVSLGWAAWYAAMGKTKSLAFVRAMMLATLFATGTGITSDLGATFKNAAGRTNDSERGQILAEGAGESMAPGIMGFSLLALTALLLAVGAVRTKQES